MIALKIWMQRDAEQPALRRGIYRQLDHSGNHRPVNDMLDLATGLFSHKKIIGSQERHRNGLVQSTDYRLDRQIRISDRWEWLGLYWELNAGECQQAQKNQQALQFFFALISCTSDHCFRFHNFH